MIAGAALFLIAATTAGAVQGPPTVMSLNVCTDQLVIELADAGQVVSLSALADDRALSFRHRDAAGFPKNRGLAEEVLAARPGRVVTGTYSLHNTTQLLGRLGMTVEEFAYTQALDTIPGDIRRMGAILGQRERAEAVAARFEEDFATLSVDAGEDAPAVLVYGQNGVVAGTGTLTHSVLETAGFRNLAAERGIVGMAPYPLELLVADTPDVVLLSEPLADAPSLADQIARHPALAASGARLVTGLVPPGAWECGGSFNIEALRALRALRDEIAAP